MTEDNPREGTVPFKVPSTGDAAHTFYKVYGDLNNGQRPVIILHGGPGAGHEYCLPFAKLHSLYNIPTIFYDQIGCAQSSHFPEKLRDATFWQFDLFVAELENLIKHFALDRTDGQGYNVIGHSWGGMLASYFASHQPTGLRRLILASATSDREKFGAGLWKKLEQMSPDAKRAVEKAIEEDDLTSPEYLAAAGEFARTYLCRARPYPPPLLAMNAKHNKEDDTVRLTLQGRSPWLLDGILGHWQAKEFAHKIAVPTFILNGEIDTSFDSEQMPYFEGIPNTRWVTFAGASHMYFLDSDDLEGKTLMVVGEFLQAAEGEWRQGERWTV